MDYSQYVDPETEEPCPYDNSHMIRRKRMQYHLMKCRKNHPGRDFATCPFNACHEMPRPELRYHIATCPDKAIIEKDLAYEQEKEFGEGSLFKGCTDVPAYNSYEVTCSESWDEESNPHPRIGVDQSFLDKVKFKNITGMTPAQKRHFHRTLNPEHNPPAAPAQTKPDKENQQPRGQGDGKLRLPKNAPKAFSMYQEQPPPQPPPASSSAVFAYSLAQCGVGRGRGIGGSMGRGVSASQPGSLRPGLMRTQPEMPRPSPTTAKTVTPRPSPVSRPNPVPQQHPSSRETPGYNPSTNSTVDHPYEAIPPNSTWVSQTQSLASQGVLDPSQVSQTVQVPPGIFPDQVRAKPVGRGRGSQPAPIDTWPTLNGGMNSNPYSGLMNGNNGDVFLPGAGNGGSNSNPSFVVPKVSSKRSDLRILSKDVFDSEENSSGSGSDIPRDVHGIEGAKKLKQLQKKIRQIEALEQKMKAGTTLNTEEEIKLSKKDELVEELESLNI